MKITKRQLKQIIREELARSFSSATGEEKYCCVENQIFKLYDAGSEDYLFISCSGTSCSVIGRMHKEEFHTKLEAGDFALA